MAVTIPSTTTSNAVLTEAYGAISGTVTGNDAGAPVLSGIEVTVYTSADALMGTITAADASGNYSVGNLPSGTYKVHFGGNANHLAGVEPGPELTGNRRPGIRCNPLGHRRGCHPDRGLRRHLRHGDRL